MVVANEALLNALPYPHGAIARRLINELRGLREAKALHRKELEEKTAQLSSYKDSLKSDMAEESRQIEAKKRWDEQIQQERAEVKAEYERAVAAAKAIQDRKFAEIEARQRRGFEQQIAEKGDVNAGILCKESMAGCLPRQIQASREAIHEVERAYKKRMEKILQICPNVYGETIPTIDDLEQVDTVATFSDRDNMNFKDSTASNSTKGSAAAPRERQGEYPLRDTTNNNNNTDAGQSQPQQQAKDSPQFSTTNNQSIAGGGGNTTGSAAYKKPKSVASAPTAAAKPTTVAAAPAPAATLPIAIEHARLGRVPIPSIAIESLVDKKGTTKLYLELGESTKAELEYFFRYGARKDVRDYLRFTSRTAIEAFTNQALNGACSIAGKGKRGVQLNKNFPEKRLYICQKQAGNKEKWVDHLCGYFVDPLVVDSETGSTLDPQKVAV